MFKIFRVFKALNIYQLLLVQVAIKLPSHKYNFMFKFCKFKKNEDWEDSISLSTY